MNRSWLDATLFGGSTLRLAAGVVFSVLLVIACVTDARWRRIPNWLVVMLAVSGFAFSVIVQSGWGGVVRAAAGLLVGFAIWIAFHLLGAMGAGDVKLFAAAGAWLGPGGAWRASLVAALLGGVLSLAALLLQRRAREGITRVMLSFSIGSVAPLGTVSPTADRKSYLPYGIALAGGALLTAWIPGLLAR